MVGDAERGHTVVRDAPAQSPRPNPLDARSLLTEASGKDHGDRTIAARRRERRGSTGAHGEPLHSGDNPVTRTAPRVRQRHCVRVRRHCARSAGRPTHNRSSIISTPGGDSTAASSPAAAADCPTTMTGQTQFFEDSSHLETGSYLRGRDEAVWALRALARSESQADTDPLTGLLARCRPCSTESLTFTDQRFLI